MTVLVGEYLEELYPDHWVRTEAQTMMLHRYWNFKISPFTQMVEGDILGPEYEYRRKMIAADLGLPT